mmetsp:Transcript_10524/g.33644  ORF Transcript_10524/g.33644 Transcript_10524/m.33644 type:complete len:378 (-) Transcript_10524:104-1237(-)
MRRAAATRGAAATAGARRWFAKQRQAQTAPGDRVGFPFRRPLRQKMQPELERRLRAAGREKAPPGMEVLVSAGLRRVCVHEWEAYEKRSAAKLASLLRRWEGEVITIEGNLGSFSARDGATLDEIYACYRQINKTTPYVGLIDGLVTLGGFGLAGTRRVCSDAAALAPPLDPDALDEVPRFIDGGMGYALSRAGPFGRCAALSGVPVAGKALELSGLATSVVTRHSFQAVKQELESLAEAGDRDYLPHTILSLLEMRTVASSYWLDDSQREFEDLARLCFEPSDLDQIKTLLGAATHPLAEQASHTLHAFPAHALLFSTFLRKCAALSHAECLDLERVLNRNLLANPLRPAQQLTESDLNAYFMPPAPTPEQVQLGF